MALTDLTRISTSGIATGTSLSGAILHGDAHFRGDQVGVTSALFDSSERELNLKDNVKLTFGDRSTGDLQVYHGGDHSFIKELGTGQLQVWSNQFRVHDSGGSDTMIAAFQGNKVVLNFDGQTKIETTKHGASVTGILTATGFSGPVVGNTNNASGISTFYDLRVSNNLTVEGTTTTLDTNLIGVDRIEVGANSNTMVGVAITQSGDAHGLYVDGTTILGKTVNLPTLAASTKLVVADLSGNNYYVDLSILGGRTGRSMIKFGDHDNRETGSIQYYHTDDSLRFFNNASSTEKLVITGIGSVGIGTDKPDTRLHVYGSSATEKLITISGGANKRNNYIGVFQSDNLEISADEDNQGSDSSIRFRVDGGEKVRIDSDGRLLVSRSGLTSSRNVGTKTGEIQIANANNSSAFTMIGYSNDAAAPHLMFGKSRAGNATGSTIVQDGDRLGEIAFCGADGTDIDSFGAAIKAFVDGTPGTNDMPGRLSFFTTLDGYPTSTERMVIKNNGNVGIGSTNPQEKLHVTAGAVNNAALFRTSSDKALIEFEHSAGSTYNTRIGSMTIGVGNVGLMFETGISGSRLQAMVIDRYGKVGIGTNSPKESLEVFTETAGRAVFRHTGGYGGVQIAGPQAASGAALMFTKGYDLVGGGTTTYSLYMKGDTNALHFVSGRADEHATKTRLLLDSSGKVGIKTTSPTAQLSIGNVTGGYMNATGIQVNRPHSLGLQNGVLVYTDIGFNATSSYRAAAFKAVGTGGNALGISTDQGSNGLGGTLNARIGFDGSGSFLGKVGIGTDNPNSQSSSANNLVVADFGGEGGITIKTNTNTAGNIFFADTAGAATGRIAYGHGATDAGDYMRFYVNSEERLRIKHDGKVGIGTNNPTAHLQVYRKTSFASNPIIQARSNEGSTNELKFEIDGDGGAYFNGNIGINSTSPNAQFVLSRDPNTNHGIEMGYSSSGSGLHFIQAYNRATSAWTLLKLNNGLGIDSSGRVLINKDTNRNKYFNGTYTGQLQVEGTDDSTRLTQFIHNSANASGHIFVIGKSRGGVGDYTVVQDDDYLGTISFQGADGDEMVDAARIEARVNANSGDPGNDDMPADLIFRTNQGHSSPREALRITSKGQFLRRQQGYSNAYQENNFGNAMYIKGGWLRFSSSFNNPTKDLVILEDGGTANHGLFIKVTVMHLDYPGTDYGIGNIHIGYASAKRKGDSSGQWHVDKSTMALESGSNFHGQNGNVGTLAWSDSNPSDTNTLSYTSNRHANYDQYHVQVEVWQRGNCSYYLHSDFVN